MFEPVEQVVEGIGVEEILEFNVENLELVFEILTIVALSNLLKYTLAGLEVSWICTSVELVLQRVLYVLLQVRRNVVSVSNVSYSC